MIENLNARFVSKIHFGNHWNTLLDQSIYSQISNIKIFLKSADIKNMLHDPKKYRPESGVDSNSKMLKKYNLGIAKLYKIIPKLNEEQQLKLLKQAEDLLIEDKRSHNRKSCSIPVSYSKDTRIYSNYIKNISRNGIFIETQNPFKIGEEILLAFSMPEFSKPLKLKGQIIQVSSNGIGVVFKNISNYQGEMIGVLVDRMKE